MEIKNFRAKEKNLKEQPHGLFLNKIKAIRKLNMSIYSDGEKTEHDDSGVKTGWDKCHYKTEPLSHSGQV